MLPTSKTNVQLPDRGTAEENELIFPLIALAEGLATGRSSSQSPPLEAQAGPGACCQRFVKSKEQR